ncbi:MAG: hypothetical protein P4L79_12925 [Legionella sp.]|uniref:hypothetical protein n=1 Tax=Legionella sp. TaxID=459 RepID=UPI00285019F3|nr:hypothetical protein [Legionella sp.]
MQSKLEQLFSTPPHESNRFRSNNSKKINCDLEYFIHSLATLGELLAEKKLGGEVPDLRYLVDTNGQAWFARETRDNAPIAPPHYRMTGSPRNAAYCKTAGNLFFSEDYSTLIKVNHKSGDFRPSFASIKWILAILVANEDRLSFKLPEALTIEELDHNGKVTDTHQCSIADIKKWLQTFKENTALTLKLKAQDAETKTVRYESERRSLIADADQANFAPPNANGVSKRLAFGDEAPSNEPSIPPFDMPVQSAKTYTALQNSSLPLFGHRKPTSLFSQTNAISSLFSGQEAPVPHFGEEFGPATPPPPKKRKFGPKRIDFVSSLTSESNADETSTPPPSTFKGYFD